jgi:sulfonate transport system permease protein
MPGGVPTRGAARMKSHKAEAFLPAVGVVGLLAIWSLVTWQQWVDPVLLPSPASTFYSLWRGMDGGPLGFDFAKTVYRTAASTLIAAVIAIPLGIVLGSSERLYRSLEFVIDFFRSTPASAMFPLFLILFGVGDETKIAVAAFGAVLVILFNVAYGVMNARKTRLLAAKAMGASRLRVLFDVMLLESLPQTFVGLRNGVSLGLGHHRGGRDVHRLVSRASSRADLRTRVLSVIAAYFPDQCTKRRSMSRNSRLSP